MKNISYDEDMLPDMILIDGGRGQLRSALNAMKQFDLPVELAAIAKARDEAPRKKSAVRSEFERIYLPGKKEPVYLEPLQPSTHLLQKIRDEVHRSAISYHKKLRSKRVLESPLEKVKGIGKTRRLLLLKHFGSLDAIRKAPVDEIASLKGMNRKVAEDLKKSLEPGTEA
ncbi:MAG: hypothetical protein HY757_05700 [Nitrospirae bacterium]|nr:hypothetical protein [Nitrospirota bacterium]